MNLHFTISQYFWRNASEFGGFVSMSPYSIILDTSGSPRKVWTTHALTSQICKYMSEIPGISKNFGMKRFIN